MEEDGVIKTKPLDCAYLSKLSFASMLEFKARSRVNINILTENNLF
jgi:hypothetical protein